ncbi:MAG: hypothetical protein U1F17_03895 [Burkholderiaceae bacterium]
MIDDAARGALRIAFGQRDGDAERHQDPAQQELRTEPPRHAVRGKHDHRRVAQRVDDRADLAIDRRIDLAHRLDLRGDRTIVRGVVRVVHVPALVAGAVRFGEDLHREVPALERQHVARDLALERRAARQARHELAVVVGAATLSVAARPERVAAESPRDVVLQLGRMRAKAVQRIVRAPLDGLHAVDLRGQPGQRHVEDRDAAPLRPEVLPERRRLRDVAGRHLVVVVAARTQLHQAVVAMPGRRDAGVERRPGRPDAEAFEAAAAAAQALAHQAREVRHRAVGGPALDQQRVGRVDAEDEQARLHRAPAAGESVAASRRRVYDR